MPQSVTLYRMLVASPGDCSEERKLIPRVLDDWNAANSTQLNVVLQPVLWEAHAHPELGDRPQAILNRQLVSRCDFVVGVFWTRLGTPTGVAESGTAEELEQFRSAGKPVLVYFSELPIPPSLLDIDQYRRLLNYQKQVEATGLAFRYAGLHDFERLFAKHLAQVVTTSLLNHTESKSIAHDKLVQALSAVAPDATVAHSTVSALKTLRTKTKYLWVELAELSPHRDEFVAEVKEKTYIDVKAALDEPVKAGHLRYSVQPAYKMVTDGSPVLNVRVSHVTTQLKNLAGQVEAESPPRKSDSGTSTGEWTAYGDG
ncbi:MAG TPA: hypothetical protein VGM27_08195 [Acidobacteriaceae bacterium]|jgi:hypothetical protein